MSRTESSTVTKPNVNLDVELFSGTSFSQNTHKEGMSRGTRDTNLASDTKAEILPQDKLQSTHLDFLPLVQPERNPQENEGLRLIVRVNSQRRKMMNIQTSKGFVQSQNIMSLSGIFQKTWPSIQMIISTNSSLKKIYRKAF